MESIIKNWLKKIFKKHPSGHPYPEERTRFLTPEERKELKERTIAYNEMTKDYKEQKDWTKQAREEAKYISTHRDGLCLTCARPYGEGETISISYTDCDRCARRGFD